MTQTVFPKVYGASRASLPARVEMWRALRARGAHLVSTWIDADEAALVGAFDQLWVRIQAEIAEADRLVLYAEAGDFPLKGAYVEAGIALALGKPVLVVCPDVMLEPDTLRPFGSWAAHPLVRFTTSVEVAVFGDF